MANLTKDQPEFAVEKSVLTHGSLHFVRRVSDGEQFLAKEFDARSLPALLHLRDGKTDAEIVAFRAAARVLNHENLISVVGPSYTAPARPLSRGGGVDDDDFDDDDFSLVYDFCADGNLKRLFDRPPVEATARGYLPEGLVWHVALGMLRALTFLHEGWREEIVLRSDDTVARRWYRLDDDWMPVLHRSIRPENIWFQARRGRETYGLCKLGNFGRCIVAGTTRDPADGRKELLATTNNLAERDASPDEMRSLRRVTGRGEGSTWKRATQVTRSSPL